MKELFPNIKKISLVESKEEKNILSIDNRIEKLLEDCEYNINKAIEVIDQEIIDLKRNHEKTSSTPFFSLKIFEFVEKLEELKEIKSTLNKRK